MSENRLTNLLLAVIREVLALLAGALRFYLRQLDELYAPVTGFERSVAGMTLSVYFGAFTCYLLYAKVALPLLLVLLGGILAVALSYYCIFPAFYFLVWHNLQRSSRMLWDRVDALEKTSCMTGLCKKVSYALLISLCVYLGYLVTVAFSRDLGAVDNFLRFLGWPAGIFLGGFLALFLSLCLCVSVGEAGLSAVGTVTGIFLLVFKKAPTIYLMSFLGLPTDDLVYVALGVELLFYVSLVFPLLFLGGDRLFRLFFQRNKYEQTSCN